MVFIKEWKKFGSTLPVIDGFNKNKRYLEKLASYTNNQFGQTQADELALDFTRKPFHRIDPGVRIKNFHKNIFNELVLII